MPNYDSDIVETYSQMRWWRDQFYAHNGPQFLLVIGSPGSGKSQMFRNEQPKGTLYLSGALSAYHLYKQMYVHLDDYVVVDDVDSLFQDKAAVNLLKCACNTDAERTLFWGKRSRELDDEAIPHRFSTTSPICILANTLTTIEANLAAVLDRAIVLQFQPSVRELHNEVGRWFEDTDVHQFIGYHLPLITEPSMRIYKKAADFKRLGADWRAWLFRRWTTNDPKLALIGQIMADKTLLTAGERIARFAEIGGGSRPTYMRKQAQWRRLTASPSNDTA